MKIELRLPLKNIVVTQYFGKNDVTFYEKYNLLGHNGIDFRAFIGCPVYASHSGKIIIRGEDSTGGKEIRIWNREGRYLTLYYHLSDYAVELGEEVCAGQLIGYTGNTGGDSTGPHLHMAFKYTDEKGNTIKLNNGYRGAEDHSSMFVMNYQGVRFSNKDWNKSNAYHRYFLNTKRVRSKEILTGAYILRRMGKVSAELINMGLYGNWSIDDIMSEAKRGLCAYITKGEFVNKHYPFQ